MDTDEDRQLMHKEMQVRRRVLKSFNKCVDDFPNEDEYNNYLEMVEDLIANLTNGVDLEKTNAFISKYRKENEDSIARNHARKLEQDRLQADKLALAERRHQQTLEKLHQEDLAHEAAQRAERLQRMRDELERIEHGEEAVRKRKRKERKRAKKRLLGGRPPEPPETGLTCRVCREAWSSRRSSSPLTQGRGLSRRITTDRRRSI